MPGDTHQTGSPIMGPDPCTVCDSVFPFDPLHNLVPCSVHYKANYLGSRGIRGRIGALIMHQTFLGVVQASRHTDVTPDSVISFDIRHVPVASIDKTDKKKNAVH